MDTTFFTDDRTTQIVNTVWEFITERYLTNYEFIGLLVLVVLAMQFLKMTFFKTYINIIRVEKIFLGKKIGWFKIVLFKREKVINPDWYPYIVAMLSIIGIYLIKDFKGMPWKIVLIDIATTILLVEVLYAYLFYKLFKKFEKKISGDEPKD